MLEKILKLYTMYMINDVRSPLPHLFGPPGCGKSTSVEQAAELLGVNLHIINVSRLSPLEVEGVQMPVDMDTDDRRLHMLPATFWSSLKENDIILFDEFLRGFPEVYNALLDIFTSRRAGAFKLPRVFIIAASNSTVAYDKALEDRLLHLPVPDPRKNKGVKRQLAGLVVDQLGLLPQMADSMEMQQLLDVEVLPMFDCLDAIGSGNKGAQAATKGRSIRNLIGQAQLREVQSDTLSELLTMNNSHAKQQSKYQFMVLLDGKLIDKNVDSKLRQLRGSTKLSPVQSRNVEINLQLIEMEEARKDPKQEGIEDDSVFFDDLS